MTTTNAAALIGPSPMDNPNNSPFRLSRSGVLTVTGSDHNDLIRLFETANGLIRAVAELDGKRHTFRADKREVVKIRVLAGGGDDRVVNGTDITSVLAGQAGNDMLIGGHGNDRLMGGSGADELRGRRGDDLLKGQAGDDKLLGQRGNDHLVGGKGDDQLFGGSGNDQLEGGKGQDGLQGGSGRDQLLGGDHDDRLISRDGQDDLRGGDGADFLTGVLGDRLDAGGDPQDIAQTTFYVDNNGDSVDGVYGIGSLTLREALQLADDHDIIRFDPLLAQGAATITLGGTALDVAYDVRIQGDTNQQLTIDAAQQSRVLRIRADTNVAIEDLIITGGHSSSNGGGIYSEGKLLLDNVVVRGNTSGQFGGAVFLSSNSSLIAHDSIFSVNVATHSGGAIYAGHGASLESHNSSFLGNRTTSSARGGGAVSGYAATLKFANDTFTNNSTGHDGGAVHALSGTKLEVTTSRFQYNRALSSGGAIYIADGFLANRTGLAEIESSRFQSNRSALGGAIYSEDTQVNVYRGSFLSNSADDRGGAIYGGPLARLRLMESQLTSNRAATGGGIALVGASQPGNAIGPYHHLIVGSTLNGNQSTRGGGMSISGSLRVQMANSTISGNRSIVGGSGIDVGTNGTLALTNATVAFNSSRFSTGGGILHSGLRLTLNNSIVARNSAGGFSSSLAADIRGNVDTANSYNNLVMSRVFRGGLRNGINGNLVGFDPRLSALQYNGGPTMTHKLNSSSLAVNRGRNDKARLVYVRPSRNGFLFAYTPLVTDQRGNGFARIRQGRVDIGAFEL